MRVLVTGATGFVGSAVVQELLAAGYQVVGLARTDAAEVALKALGVEARRGLLEHVDGLRAAAASVDGVIHTAFNHDFSRFAANCELDRRAITALGEGLLGTNRPLLVTSGVALLAQGRPAQERDMPPPPGEAYPRASEAAADALLERGLRVGVVRLPPSVHGDGDHGFIPMLIQLARERGASGYVEAGANRWAAVHRLDAARVFRLALDANEAGARYHAVGDEGVPFREIAGVIARRLGLPLVGKSGADAAAHFGWFTHFASADMAAASAWTRERLGWRALRPGLLADVDRSAYFGQ